MQNMEDFTHFNDQGRARMVDVGEKAPSHRTAVAGARVLVSPETFRLIQTGGMKKGDVLTVAQIAGVMGAKRTPDLIPMCHAIGITGINLELSLDEARCAVDIRATVSCDGRTGVEMEARAESARTRAARRSARWRSIMALRWFTRASSRTSRSRSRPS